MEISEETGADKALIGMPPDPKMIITYIYTHEKLIPTQPV